MSTRWIRIGCIAMLSALCACPRHTAAETPRPRDAGAVSAAGPRATPPVIDAPSVTPRLVWPLSGARLSGARPVFRWTAAGAVAIELCRDRACATVAQRITASATSAAPPSDLPAGLWYWRVATTQPSPSRSAVWSFRAPSRSAAQSRTIGYQSDVNNDGFADALAHGALLLGRGAAPYLEPARRIAPAAESSTMIADVDGDGASDVAVAAARGRGVRIFAGSSNTGVSAQPVATIDAPEASSTFGGSVEGVGDVNGDGYGDVAIGSYGRASVYVYGGSASGLSARPMAVLRPVGRGHPSSFGSAIAGLGDVNGDGFDDLAIESDGARSEVFFGAATGPTSAAWTQNRPYNGGAGARLFAAGDVDGDGFADAFDVQITFGGSCVAPRWIRGASSLAPSPLAFARGSSAPGDCARLVLPFGAGDLNGDGFGDVLVFDRDTDGRSTLRAFAGASGGATTRIAVSDPRADEGSEARAVGDVDRDGYDDAIIDAPFAARATRVQLLRGTGAAGARLTATTVALPR